MESLCGMSNKSTRLLRFFKPISEHHDKFYINDNLSSLRKHPCVLHRLAWISQPLALTYWFLAGLVLFLNLFVMILRLDHHWLFATYMNWYRCSWTVCNKLCCSFVKHDDKTVRVLLFGRRLRHKIETSCKGDKTYGRKVSFAVLTASILWIIYGFIRS